MTSDEQLRLWVEGKPAHADECCPDFSCCVPELLAPEHERKAFADATQEGRYAFLGGFLARAFANHGKTKVHIAGDHGEEQ